MAYLSCTNIRLSDSGKTYVMDVFNGPQMLGEIRWHAPWRRYCFYPKEYTIWDRNCLTEVVALLDRQMQLRKGSDPDRVDAGEIRQRT